MTIIKGALILAMARRLKRYLEDPSCTIPERTLSRHRRFIPMQDDDNPSGSDESDGSTSSAAHHQALLSESGKRYIQLQRSDEQ